MPDKKIIPSRNWSDNFSKINIDLRFLLPEIFARVFSGSVRTQLKQIYRSSIPVDGREIFVNFVGL